MQVDVTTLSLLGGLVLVYAMAASLWTNNNNKLGD